MAHQPRPGKTPPCDVCTARHIAREPDPESHPERVRWAADVKLWLCSWCWVSTPPTEDAGRGRDARR